MAVMVVMMLLVFMLASLLLSVLVPKPGNKALEISLGYDGPLDYSEVW